ncbi:hypothetical protein PoB_006011600 [Plakobranchus ocellatus]|uniref:Uncharacterized protein n=1 Tax=Plakobranchus ocellatus TaxID=259542 RepID=A0AAV4CP07_9GAST|nr:hypothetical protein PoB_006011600 [Plakobranchus ocellatus]
MKNRSVWHEEDVMERHAQFPKETHISGQKLFSVTCSLVLDHTKKSHYIKDLGPAALMFSPTEAIKIGYFWNSAFEAVPNLSFSRGVYATVSSADAERNFSLYNIV